MANKITNFVFLTLLFLLQSCSGAGIGNFLESSFKNNNFNKISQNNSNREIKSDIITEEKDVLKKKKYLNNKIKPNDENKTLDITNSTSIKLNDSNIIKKTNQKFQPKSYRIFVILKKVDPSFPTENFSKVLRNGNINFEIEKIELIPELNQNKKSM